MRGLTARLLIFNLLLAVFPIGAVLFLGTYESQLLESQERAMVQQGRLLASALAGHDLAVEAAAILDRLGARTDARLRVVDQGGFLVADSARPSRGAESPEEESDVISTLRNLGTTTNPAAQSVPGSFPEENVIYRIGALPTRTIKTVTGFLRPPQNPVGDVEYYGDQDYLDGPEIRAALNGRYGAATRISRGQKSVTLYSAIPVFRDDEVVGAVLVSRSTFAILSDLYKVRLDIATIFLFSVGAAIVLSILLARTVTVPVGRLRDQAESILDERGKLQEQFHPLSGRDEVADLSRALYRLSTRLQQRTSHMEDFMADLVHEMKNPVAGILSASELADRDASPEVKRFLGVIDREGRRIQRLLDDLRELISVDVRLDRGRRDRVDVRTLLSELIGGYPRHRLGGTILEFQDRTAAGHPALVDADPDRLAQAVLNLIDNAVSFTPESSAVEVLLDTPEPAFIGVTVADRGPGIPPEVSDKVFERWYTDRPGSETAEHTGLGLAIVRSIAEGYGGHVSLRNRDGGGAEFLLVFPESPAAAR